MNDIIFNSKKEKYYKLYVYINSLRIILPKIIRFIFANQENIPKYFIDSIDEILKIWRDKWEIFDHKFFQGLFIYIFNYSSNEKIERFYSETIKNELLDKYSTDIENLSLIEPKKIKIIGNEYGLDTDTNASEIISGLKKIKKMELLINLSKDIDGKEFNIIKNTDTQETSKIQKALERMENNFNVNKHINDEDDEQTIDNNDNNNFDDIDGEPL